jgi:arylsulfatase A-like enzyme
VRDILRGPWPSALVLGLGAGAIDLLVSLRQRPRDFADPAALAPAALATAALFLIVHLVSWAVVGHPLARRIGLAPASAAIALSVFFGTAFTLGVFGQVELADPTPLSVFHMSLVGLIAGAAAVGAFWAAEGLRAAPARRERAGALSLACPPLLYALLLYAWAQLYAIDSIVSLASALATAAVLLTIAGVLGVALRGGTAATSRLLGVLILGLLLAPLVYLVRTPGIGGAQRPAQPGPRSPRHVILLSADTLRADALSCYDEAGVRTPRIDRLAADGVVFRRAISPAPWTLPSVASILTGLSPKVHLVTTLKSRLSDRATTLAEHMGRAGYHTAAIVQNDLLRARVNLSQGFAEYVVLHEPSYGGALGAWLLQKVLPASHPSPPWPSIEDHTRIAVEWLAANRHRDFFLWVHFYDPHVPYTPSLEYVSPPPPPGVVAEFHEQRAVQAGLIVPSLEQRQWIRRLYEAEVRGLDASLGRVIATLERLDLYDDALVVFTSDHGEEFWEHGGHGHGHSQYNELLEVPLIVKLPGFSRRGEVRAVVSTTSVGPTMLELAGLAQGDGTSAPSLVPLIRTAPPPPWQQPVFSTAQFLFDRKEAVFFRGSKWIWSPLNGKTELFDLDRDPGEFSPVTSFADERAEEARRLFEENEREAASLREKLGIVAGVAAVDPDTLRRLRALGYVQ